MRSFAPAVIGAMIISASAASAQESATVALGLQQRPIAAISCPMPVHVPAQRNDMPIVRPDTTIQAKILVIEPRCQNPLGPFAGKPPIVLRGAASRAPSSLAEPSKGLAEAIRDAFGNWLMRQPPDTSKRPPRK